MNLILKDSQYIKPIEHSDNKNLIYFCTAINKLKEDTKKKKIDFFSLGGVQKELDEELIWYEVNSIKNFSRTRIIDKISFFTSHYIGFYSTKIHNQEVNIKIEPRFGDGVFNYLISYAYGIYLPKGTSSSSKEKSNSLWLIALMWKATLNRAITKSQIPKEYQKEQKNLNTFKGQLNISKHIQNNLFDKSKFYCNYRKLTMDTTINQTIRYTYQLLEKKGFGGLLKDIAEYDLMLQSFGVKKRGVTLSEIQNIRYSKLNIYYKKVMELSKLIIKSQSKSSDITSNSNDSFSYFIDIAQLWEDYLLKVLQRNLSQYEIYSPNDRGGISLFDDSSREIRPDIIIKQNGKVVAILDAKYKWYNQIGKTSKDFNSVSREDLYQMSTYMYRYAQDSKKCVGFFISPMVQSKANLKTLSHNPNHQMGVLNLNLQQFNTDEENKVDFSFEQIRKEENKFIEQIKEILGS
ncbi:MAG: hypothetical protein U9N49_05060 [Campylobacterota bacterium]|nr:hypothetical protein [Campylobacterota bacterium]